MSPGTMVVLIVLIAMIGGVLKQRYRALEARNRREGSGAGELGEARDEVRRLQERVAVLERVVTDNHGSDLDRQIERLRDR
jgi:predicted site-specific integrase-resolvase